jgi:hypothetical protein
VRGEERVWAPPEGVEYRLQVVAHDAPHTNQPLR